ncbi:MAG: hypothetical protein H6555_00365 [Lewinellaceae bacterium]|nr:hypothetical protein [Lewinellaceae bacterium]
MKNTKSLVGKPVQLETVQIEGESFYQITNVDQLRPFFMSIVSDSNHWMFISSNGGLSAGRKNAEFALFPYYTDDKITESAAITGSKTIIQVHSQQTVEVWEPFLDLADEKYEIRRNLYKNEIGNKIIFEEINVTLGISFQYGWNFNNEFGFVKKSKLTNLSDQVQHVRILDGIQNIVPYGVGSDLQNRASNLVDAYKRNELDRASGMGLFALSAIIVDKAEPSEALKTNIAFALGLENPKYLLSSRQLKAFRLGGDVTQEEDVKAEKGAYFIVAEAELRPGQEKTWMVVANVNQTHAAVVRLIDALNNDPHLGERIQEGIIQGTENLWKLVAAADGVQVCNDSLQDSRHFSNVLFNCMRGGIFDANYELERSDFLSYLAHTNRSVFQRHQTALNQLAEVFSLFDLEAVLQGIDDADLFRIASEYLPLKFSRRHGDPSRPWNRFSINTHSEIDGSKILDYEGNWRDIFQNWEALAHSYPGFITGMLFKFLNASTFDGYNPYRVTKGGFDWETIEPDDPWSYIGYWGDHQIIYLLKFLEFAQQHTPQLLNGLWDKKCFVYANVPYRIKSYAEICKNPKDTIDFDFDLDHKINARREDLGADGALLQDQNGQILHVNFTEKILATVLAKLSNYILEGGIWMNTQRPEWNDANNALVGNGVSMVTLYYLRRFMHFFHGVITETTLEDVQLSSELADFYGQMRRAFTDHKHLCSGNITDQDRKKMLDVLGNAASQFRDRIYVKGFAGTQQAVSIADLREFAALTCTFLEQSIKANRRTDHLYHGYNLMTISEEGVQIVHLNEMLEGQVAVLSSGFLSAKESLQVLDGLKKSALFRDDQYSYILYPNKRLPGFLEKNTISRELLEKSHLLPILAQKDCSALLEQDIRGNYHFNGNFKNANDLKAAIDADGQLSEQEEQKLLALFEEVFQHKAFTGRSGTFFGYEGLGSIYWHMVSKLRLAVLETCLRARDEKADAETLGRLIAHYFEITAGIGVHKSPELYGAFPTDPYSHTPMGKGAQQPGMTGQVKEDILCRLGELGISAQDGVLGFHPAMLRRSEFLDAPKNIAYVDVRGHKQSLKLNQGSLFFTYCQVPVIYEIAGKEGLEIHYADGQIAKQEGLILDEEATRKIWNRTGEIRQLKASVRLDQLL